MNYEDVLTFLTVLETQNIAQAARTLFVSQGTASTRIRRLEEELGIPLAWCPSPRTGWICTGKPTPWGACT